MDKREMADQLVAAFGKTLTVDGLHLDPETNSCLLVFDDNIVLNIEYDAVAERMLFSVYLDELPKEGAEPLLRHLMGANLYWHRTKGATLCLEEGTNGVILVYPSPVDRMNDVIFETVVENIVQQAENWKKKIAAWKEPLPEASPQAEQPLRPDTGVIYG